MRGCDLLGCRGPAVWFAEGCSPVIEGNRIVGGGASGLVAAVGARGLVRDNDILQHSHRAAVEVRGGASTVVEKNRTANNLLGVLILDGGRAKLSANQLADNLTAAVSVAGPGSSVEMYDTLVTGTASSSGLVVADHSDALVAGGEIQGVHTAVAVGGGSHARLRGLRAFHCKADGLAVRGQASRLELHACEVFSAEGVGVRVAAGAHADLVECKIFHNVGPGLDVDSDCTGRCVSRTTSSRSREGLVPDERPARQSAPPRVRGGASVRDGPSRTLTGRQSMVSGQRSRHER